MLQDRNILETVDSDIFLFYHDVKKILGNDLCCCWGN